jgi:hypothetical protein
VHLPNVWREGILGSGVFILGVSEFPYTGLLPVHSNLPSFWNVVFSSQARSVSEKRYG